MYVKVQVLGLKVCATITQLRWFFMAGLEATVSRVAAKQRHSSRSQFVNLYHLGGLNNPFMGVTKDPGKTIGKTFTLR